MADGPYIFFELTNSLCSTCLQKVEAKVIFQEWRVYLEKHCPEHKQEKVLISTDVEHYQFSRPALKPGTMPRKFNTAIERGCPDDCGLCPDHEQHSCLALVEITDHCNLTCPICYSFAVAQPCVRGVTFQPVQAAGRLDGFDAARDRLTLAEVRAHILAQSSLFQPADIAPVPCHPDCLAMAYALKLGGQLVPLTRLLDPYNFDVRSVKKSCIHIVHPDGRIIPFDTYHLFYRDTAAARMPAAVSRPELVTIRAAA